MALPPHTEASLAADLERLGVRSGMLLMVHASLGQLGWTMGGAAAVVRALASAVGPEGTLAMPAESPSLGDPATWGDPRVDPAWYEAIRADLPPFDPATTPCTMGAIAESFRTGPGTLRSPHPMVSMCARGPRAPELTGAHPLELCEGPGTPFARLYDLDGWTLLLGVGFDRCTSLHHAESRSAHRRTATVAVRVVRDGVPAWQSTLQMATDGGTLFPVVGQAFVQSGQVATGEVGSARAMLFSTRALVDFATPWLDRALGV